MIAIIGSSAGRDSTKCSFLTFAAPAGSFAAIKAVNPATARQSPVQLCLALNRQDFMPESDLARPTEFHNTVSLRQFPWDGQQKAGGVVLR